MFVDSHCHLDLQEFDKDIDLIMEQMSNARVDYALVAGIDKKNFNNILKLISNYDNLYASVGMHPECSNNEDFSIEELCFLAKHNKKIVAIGETGLDYHRNDYKCLDWQRNRFRKHIRAAKISMLPLIIHTRSSIVDVLNILKEEGASDVGGVMHCFTENWDAAKLAMNLNFYISISGIVTFKNARIVHELAKKVPLDRILIETDSPYLSPEPYRGKINNPANVIYVANKIAELRKITVEEVAYASKRNFFSLFTKIGL
ncbi:MAG: TatD family hydrolase [Candidatus Kinetoplastibacterium crithidii]|nr:MAG: TatD family hydrolase [Candidatus Kinetoplastibacterium crithidii]